MITCEEFFAEFQLTIWTIRVSPGVQIKNSDCISPSAVRAECYVIRVVRL